MALLAIPLLTCIACSDPDAEFNNNGSIPSTGPVKISDPDKDWTATKDVKSLTIESQNYSDYMKLDYVIHADFSRRYFLGTYQSNPAIAAQERKSGEWTQGSSWNWEFGILSVGKCDKIDDITEKPAWSNNSAVYREYNVSYGIPYCVRFYVLKPKTGYVARIVTEDNEVKYIRIFTSSYTVDENDNIKTVTLQYQLF